MGVRTPGRAVPRQSAQGATAGGPAGVRLLAEPRDSLAEAAAASGVEACPGAAAARSGKAAARGSQLPELRFGNEISYPAPPVLWHRVKTEVLLQVAMVNANAQPTFRRVLVSAPRTIVAQEG